MGPIKRLAAVLYLVASVLALGYAGLSLAGPLVGRMAELREEPAFRIMVLACVVIMALQAFYVLGLALFSRREPVCVRPEGTPDIEVTREAIASVARAAARSENVMVEDVEVRVSGRSHAAVVLIQAIPLVNEGLAGEARRTQLAVEEACERMLGVAGTRVRVRFLPAKTVTKTVTVKASPIASVTEEGSDD